VDEIIKKIESKGERVDMEPEKEQLYKQIDALEYERNGYLEANDKAGARRKAKKIEELELQIELLDLKKIKKELSAYKEICRNYPEIQERVKEKLNEKVENK